VWLDESCSIFVDVGSALIAEGTPDSTIVFTRSGDHHWGTVAGVLADLTLRHCLIEWGSTGIFIERHNGMLSNAAGSTVAEDCTLQHGGYDGTEFQSGSLTVRRSLLQYMRQGFNIWGGCVATVEDNRVEHCTGDAFDITQAEPGELVLRNNVVIDAGDDALDIDGWGAVEVGYFEAYDVADKGISVSSGSTGVMVVNMIMSNCQEAYVASNNSSLRVVNCVAYGCQRGFSAYERAPHYGGGQISVFNSIAWDTTEPVFLDSLSHASIFFSILDTDTPYPGPGNLNSDPGFRAPGQNDFALLDGSPAIDAAFSSGAPEFDIRGAPRVDHPGIPDTGAGPFTYFDIGAHEFDPATVAIGERNPAPRGLSLRAFPSPASGPVGIEFELAVGGAVEVGVYDPAGRLVERVFAGQLVAGRHTFDWDGGGPQTASGLYFIRLRSASEEQVERLVRIR
jgi:hypothetical protein